MHKIRHLLLSGILLLLGHTALAQQRTGSVPGTPTTFAIVIDQASYDAAQAEVEAYRAVIEADGLGTYLIIGQWDRPDPIRAMLRELHLRQPSPLEGAVLIGDIPIPMIRDGQHLTSAFKMDQRWAWQRSSVPSDRYYDDFDLRFDYLRQDSISPQLHYYALRPDGAQHVSADIYTARIKPYDSPTADRYAILRDYLRRVVEIRTADRAMKNRLDRLSTARGQGYNSESQVSWSAEQLILSQQVPLAFTPSGSVHFADHDAAFPIKPAYLRMVSAPGLDVMLFDHHGSPDTQYLNGYRPESTAPGATATLKRILRGKIREDKDSIPREAKIEKWAKRYDLPTHWGADAFDPEVIRMDSLNDRAMDIHLDDLAEITPAARLVVLDACFNGSFHKPKNVANTYLFNPTGKTLAIHANSVNVLQDKWGKQLLGLLPQGARIGTWHRLTCLLETHLFGDPTYHFYADTPITELVEATVLHERDDTYWLRLLSDTRPDIAALALHMLSRSGYPGIAEAAHRLYFTSPQMSARTEAVLAIAHHPGQLQSEVYSAALGDSYEFIRRTTAGLVCKDGNPDLIPAFVQSYYADELSARVSFNKKRYLHLLPLAPLRSYVKQYATTLPTIYEERTTELLDAIDRAEESKKKTISELTSPETSAKDKIFILRSLRNLPDTNLLQELLEMAEAPETDRSILLTLVEALGWYEYSYRAPEIATHLSSLYERTPADDPELKTTLLRAINRLK